MRSRRGGWREKGDPNEPDNFALGRSRGWTTKLIVLCDSEGNPLHIHLTPGQVHDSSFEEVLRGVDERLIDAIGRPIDWPDKLAGDKAYRAQWIDDELRNARID